jgi:hypothetical protein
MASIHLGSDLLETQFTPQELNTAQQLQNRDLSIALLQNTKVEIVRRLAFQQFEDPAQDEKEQRVRAYWKGQLDLLEQLIQTALNPTPVPLESSQPS